MQNWVAIGNLTKDPEKIQGQELVRFSIAVQENYRDANGNRAVQYFNVMCWNKLGENCLQYLKKGSKVYIDGKLQNRSYEKDGIIRHVTEIIANEVEFL